MIPDDFPLIDLFTKLHDAGLPLGIDDYKLLLKAFQGGFGVKDVDSLERLCRALWVKSDEEELLFAYHFGKIRPELIQKQERAKADLRKSEPEPDMTPPSEPETDSRKDSARSSEKPEEFPETNPQFPDPTETELDEMNPDDPARASETIPIKDEAAEADAVSAVQVKTLDAEEIPSIRRRFILSGNYFPVTRRQMKQSWRYLRCFVRQGKKEELDVETTVNEIGKQGVLLEPVMVPKRINRVELLLLTDQNGPMVPFHALSERLRETAVRGGRLGRANAYYFHNVPADWLYQDTALIEAEKTEDVLFRLDYDNAKVLIISDAGAARGGFSTKRLELTLAFLKKLKSYVSHIAWLNPMPRFRWLGTSAGAIEQEVAMFEMSRRGLDYAISALRGRV